MKNLPHYDELPANLAITFPTSTDMCKNMVIKIQGRVKYNPYLNSSECNIYSEVNQVKICAFEKERYTYSTGKIYTRRNENTPPHPIYIVDNLQIIEFLQDDILYLFHQELASNGQEKSSNGEEKKYS